MPFCFGALGDQLAYILRRSDIAAGRTLVALDALALFNRSRGHDGRALGVVDHLGINVVHRAINVQPRTLGGAGQFLANPVMYLLPRFVFRSFSNHLLCSRLSAISLQQLPATSRQSHRNCHPERSEGPAFLSLNPILTCWATNCFALRAFTNCYFAPVLPTFFFRRSLV